MKVAAVKSPGGLDRIVIEDRPKPTAKAGEILVRVRASSLNFHDFAVVAGMIRTPDGRIPMSDGAGTVEAVGEGVTRFKVGDEVLSTFFPNWDGGGPQLPRLLGVPGDQADGFAAEYVAMPATAFTRMPRGWSFKEAATLPCAALTAWRALIVEARIKPGDIVLTQGTGGVSIFALQLAKAAGCTVVSTSSSAEKLARLKDLGADHLINYKEEDKWGEAAMKLTGGRGVNAVVEIGGAGTMAQSIAACGIGGHISLIGVLAGISGEVPTALAFSKNVCIQGITVGSRQSQEEMIAAIEANGIKPVIDSTFPLEGISAAFAHQMSQKHFGKICLEF
ncbi:NADPH:quinone reductase-like Zn-dependent oxidoreductase [Caulobacter ginsengisoli]|uniref:NADPH:quinone reductase-like Zn-dependent oxidoreductase n=1 Tax=Caulobacter ginsengisoli TaxID=400775 RepID=A0ABU0IQT9_9CAUL|nr:NAD(P)-dependent alcohol dehydrogenase [Caulobacter ginsengisoli]MDQ0464379.1 NADPH:quinone reductase-like Zn-dependent oxidoreductase [Caulobacter ginsengisoli]